MDSVYRYRYMSTGQVHQRHFHGLSRTPVNRSLARLVRVGVIKWFTVANVPERIYRLTADGADYVAAGRGLERHELRGFQPRRKEPKHEYFMRHFLGVGDVRLAIERETENHKTIGLDEWVPEYDGTMSKARVFNHTLTESLLPVDGGHRIKHRPDAAFVLSRGGRSGLFFLEYDRGTETVTSPEKGVYKLVRFYLAALDGHGFQVLRSRHPNLVKGLRLLLVVESENRAHSIRERLSGIIKPPHRNKLRGMWVAVAPLAQPLTHEWQSLLVSDTKAYRLAG